MCIKYYCYKSNAGCQILKIEHILKMIQTFVVIHVFLFWISQEIMEIQHSCQFLNFCVIINLQYETLHSTLNFNTCCR